MGLANLSGSARSTMNTLTVTQDEIDQCPSFEERAELLRSKGAPIPEGEIAFPTEYLVSVDWNKHSEPGEFPVYSFTYTWKLKDVQED